MTKETTVTMTSEETITQTLSHKVPPKIVTLPASSIYRTITKVQAPEPVSISIRICNQIGGFPE